MSLLIEVSIHFGNEEGNGVDAYLVDVGEEVNNGFDTTTHRRAIETALARFHMRESHGWISRIDIRHSPKQIIKAAPC